MKARIFTTASLLALCSSTLPAVDPQLLNLVMPDVKVLADVNVTQAKFTPFGQYVLSQVEIQHFQEFQTQTGFDPSKDLNELLFASNGAAGSNNGLALATGIFNVATITAAATAKGAATTTYKGVSIILNPNKTEGVAFVNSGVLIAGTVANVQAAIDRQTTPQPIPSALSVQANQLSQTEDAWVISTVPPASLANAPKAPAAAPGIGNLPQNVATQIQQGWAGVKFGANVVLTAQAQADNAQDATNLANMLQLLVNLGQMNASQNTNAPNIASATTIAAQGNNVNITITLPEDQFQQLLNVKARPAHRIQHM